MTRYAKPLLVAVATLVLGACASAPVHYYTLLPSATAAPPSPGGLAFEVLPVGVPAQVDQPQLVVRQGGQSVALLEGERWIAPLADEVRGALAADLARALPGRNVGGMAHDDKPVLQVTLDLRRFDSQPGSHALIEGTWSIRLLHGAQPASLACTSQVSEAVGPGYDALVQGHQRALDELATQMAGVARSLAAGHGASCPAD